MRLLTFITLLLLAFGHRPASAQDQNRQIPDGFATLTSENEALLRDALPRLKRIQTEAEERIFEIEGVQSLGITWRQGEPAFLLGLQRGVTVDGLPSEIDGVPVHIRPVDPVRTLDGLPNCNGGAGQPCHANQTPLPVEMGNSGRWFGAAGGCTLGFKACDAVMRDVVVVTNSHCAQFGRPSCGMAPLGDPVWHPAWGDGGPGITRDVIGRLSGHAAPSCRTTQNFVDATKFVSPFFSTTTSTRDIGMPNGYDLDPLPGRLVWFSGRSSGTAFGFLIAVNVRVEVPAAGGFCCGPLSMRDQLEFDPVAPVIGGDSGSGVFTINRGDPALDRILVGLLWGGSGEDAAYANRLDRVADALGITYDISDGACPR